MNWFDLIILIFVGLYVWYESRRGFLSLAWELFGIIIAFLLALRFYPFVGLSLETWHVSSYYAKSIAFLFIWILTQLIFYLIGRIIDFYTPSSIKQSKINLYLGVIPASAKVIIFLAVVLILLVIIPINSSAKNLINNSFFGGILIRQTAQIESQIEKVFSGEGNISLTHTTPLEDSALLNFSTTDFKIDESAEQKIFEKVNSERSRAGLPPLQNDILIRNVARAHSRDMLIKGYFSHNSPDGMGLFERLNLANVKFDSAAENIALAPTIDLAHIGLMNSPKHKANILDPDFTIIGIGVIDAGPYGLMVTEDFVN